MHFVFMGVSGSGKSTVALGTAEELGLPYAEADAFHPAANIAKMASGTPLTDLDRRPWLESLAEWIRERERAGESSIMACSALKRSYRDILRATPGVFFIHLAGPTELIAERLRPRLHHFMPSTLLASQASALEPLAPDEDGTVLDIARTPRELIAESVRIITRALE